MCHNSQDYLKVFLGPYKGDICQVYFACDDALETTFLPFVIFCQ